MITAEHAINNNNALTNNSNNIFYCLQFTYLTIFDFLKKYKKSLYQICKYIYFSHIINKKNE